MVARSRQVLLALLLSSCVPHSHAARSYIVEKKESEAPVNGLALVASDSPPKRNETIIDVDGIAREMNAKGFDPKEFGKEGIKIWLRLFASGNITGDAVALAAWETFGVAARMIHPLLGTAFTLISKLFGIGTNPDNALVEMIMDRVRIMIDQALATVNINFQQKFFSGVMRAIRYGPNQPDHVAWYAERQSGMLESAPHIFPHCLTQSFSGSLESLDNLANISSDDCLRWQVLDSRGGLRALMLEIQWVNLHIQLAGVIATQKNVKAWNIAREEVRVLHSIVHSHFIQYRRARGGHESSTLGHAPRGCTGFCIRQGRDTVLDRELTGPRCRASPRRSGWGTYYPAGPPTSRVTYQHFGRRRAPQERLAQEFRQCRDEHGDRLRRRLTEDVLPMVNAIQTWIRGSAGVRF